MENAIEIAQALLESAELMEAMQRECRAAADEIEAKDKRIAELEAGLKPFAEAADGADGIEDDRLIYVWIADLRRARALLSGQRPDAQGVR